MQRPATIEMAVFSLGFALLLVLGVVIGRRLGGEYRSRMRPSIPTLAAVWAFYGVHFGLVVWAAVRSTWHFSLPGSLALAGGISLIVAGAVVYLSAVRAFGFKRQAGLDTTRLVTEGIYRWSRNPLLVGWALILAGVGLLRESAMILLLTLVFWLGYRLSLPLEEELLGRLYGEAYETYRQRTSRYLGLPRKAPRPSQNQGMRPTALGGG